MSHLATAPTPELAPDIIAALRPDSQVTLEGAYLDDKPIWKVVIDGEIVATFDDDDEHDNEEASEQVRAQIQERIENLATRAALVVGVRDLADFLEAHPEIPDPHVWAWVNQYSGGTTAVRDACEALRPLGFETKIDGSSLKVSHKFGPVKFEVEAKAKHVCEERVEVKEVREAVVPDWAQPPTPDDDAQAGEETR